MNPSAGKTDLPDFESGPFNHLGTSPNLYKLFSKKNLTQDVINSALYRKVYEKMQELKKSCIECADRIIDGTIR